MKEIKIFNDKRFSDKGIAGQLPMFGALCYLLAEALQAETKDEAWEILHEASQIGHPLDSAAFNALYVAAATEITIKFKGETA